MNYDFRAIEQKWQKKWVGEKSFKAIDFHPTKPKYYVLYEFYNISGNLHMGHLKGTIPADALARYKRFCGYNVLFPIGGDAFGLPAENAAIKKGINPHTFVRDGMQRVIEQSKALGLSFDWDRTICTSDPEYYHWTQWIFLQLLKNGKAYKKKGYVNFCPNCQTVLSNEDSQGGKCDRCGGDVVQMQRDVWFLKMKEYAEKLLGNVERIQMAENLKEAQRNWIGKSEGMQVCLDVFAENGKENAERVENCCEKGHENGGECGRENGKVSDNERVENDKEKVENGKENSKKIGNIEIFTTCIETIYGMTFVVLAPENKLVDELKCYIKNFDEVEDYRKKTALRSEFDRKSNLKEKSGCKLDGVFAVNPINGAKVQVFLGDFVLASYGTGAVMAVPCHDQRDFEFAKAFNIPFIQVIEGDCSKNAVEKKEYLSANSKMLNSAEFTGLPVKEAKQKIAEKVENLGCGKRVTNYAITDWSFNRQRYWGEPFPVVFCDHCGVVPLDEKDLPLVLPQTDDYLPNANGDSPLSKIESFVHCKCPRCGRDARRETDTMPNWAGSSWYWLRYCDPHNPHALADFEKLKYWGSVDTYTGGTEHITRHVLYAFFWQNFLYEIGAVPTRDPFIRKMGSGLILDDTGRKMSKSSANGVSPSEVIEKYGVDATRMHVHFLGGYEDNTPWSYDGITGITAFLDKLWTLQDVVVDDSSERVKNGEIELVTADNGKTDENAKSGENGKNQKNGGNERNEKNEEGGKNSCNKGVSRAHVYELNRLIKKVGEDLEDLKLNTCISAYMIFLKKVRDDGFITKEELRKFLVLVNPIAPHITSEIFERVFGTQILDETWPKYDEKFLVEDEIKLPVQVNGKLARVVTVARGLTQEQVLDEVCKQFPQICPDRTALKKVVYVPDRILNLIK